MSLFNIFKKKKLEEKKVKPKEKLKKIEDEQLVKIKSPKIVKEKKAGQAYRFLKAPHVTEKAGDLTGKNQYIFKIYPKADKIKVKRAIEDVFNVDVISVKIINVSRKKRRLGRISGWRKGYKKAIVGIREGQKIEVLPR